MGQVALQSLKHIRLQGGDLRLRRLRALPAGDGAVPGRDPKDGDVPRRAEGEARQCFQASFDRQRLKHIKRARTLGAIGSAVSTREAGFTYRRILPFAERNIYIYKNCWF